MPLGVEVGLGPGDFVFDRDPAPQEKGHSPTQFLAHVYCVQAAGRIKVPLGMDVGLSAGDSVLDGAQLPPKGACPNFRPMSIVAKRSPISASADLLSLYQIGVFLDFVKMKKETENCNTELCVDFPEARMCHTVLRNNKNSSGDEIANVNFYSVRLEATRVR